MSSGLCKKLEMRFSSSNLNRWTMEYTRTTPDFHKAVLDNQKTLNSSKIAL
jgi:hypothetical protein